MEEALKNVAEAGDVNGLYSLIEQEPFMLDRFDPIPFVDTPLHIATRDGKAQFAMEIVYLKPSLARKLNQSGFSPMHIALAEEQWTIARGLLQTDKEVVRVKGRGGRTPLHEVAVNGNTDLLNEFLSACPESVEDLTVQLETALHLAVKSSRLKAFMLLLESLEEQDKSQIMNWKNDQGNTVLHVATSTDQQEFVKVLLSKRHVRGLEVNAINSEGLTALDILEQTRERKKLGLFRLVGALKSQEISADTNGSVQDKAESQKAKYLYSTLESITYFHYKVGRDSPHEVRNALLVVVGLIATATYQTGISPPTGNWQYTADGGRVRHGRSWLLGKEFQFCLYAFLNSLGFHLSLIMMIILTMGFPLQNLLVIALISMVANYAYSLTSIAPKGISDDAPHSLFTALSIHFLPIFGTIFLLFIWEKIFAKRKCRKAPADVEQVAHVRDADSVEQINA